MVFFFFVSFLFFLDDFRFVTPSMQIDHARSTPIFAGEMETETSGR
jgi:hypothetical protein